MFEGCEVHSKDGHVVIECPTSDIAALLIPALHLFLFGNTPIPQNKSSVVVDAVSLESEIGKGRLRTAL